MTKRPDPADPDAVKLYLRLLKALGVDFLEFDPRRSFAKPCRESIGPEGGILSCGPHRLLIQEHAVATSTTFSIVEQPLAGFANSVSVEIRADGAEHTAFFRPVILGMSYAGAKLRAGQRPRILPWDWGHGSLPLPQGVHDPQQEVVYASLDHLSTYVLIAP